ncbi:head-tail connector protein [Caulobacter sp. DWR3-1-2]|uniref:head-tail connector protein n=1 Tax=Caulobacter sp. DWR3-1-2 TaxID=2804647 RepID=UPI003CECAC1E
MSVVVITPPAPLVSLALAKQHLRIDGGDEDVLVQAYIASTTDHIDGPEGWLGRAIGSQTLEWRGPAFPANPSLALPLGPARSIVSVKYLDQAGVDQTWPDANYRLVGDCLTPDSDVVWPRYREEANAVRVQWVAGYEATPPAIVGAVLLLIGEAYSNREPVLDLTMSSAAGRLLKPFKNWRV